MTGSKQILIITPLDYNKLKNNVEHNRVDHYARLGHRITVIHSVLNRSSRFRDLVRDTCLMRVQCQERDGIRFVAVDPFFNYYGGLRHQTEAKAAASGRRWSVRLLAARVLSPLAALRDLFVVPSFVLAACLKVDRSDVCLGVGPWGAIAGWALRRLRRTRLLVFEDHDYEPGLVPDRLRRSYIAAGERFAVRHADLTISVGARLSRLRKRQTGRTTHVISNGVDWAKFAVARRAPHDQHRLLYVGNVIAWSGLELAIRAMPRIRASIPDVRLIVVGGGLPGYLDYLETLVRDLDVSSRVDFLGQRAPEELGMVLADAEVGLANSEPVPFRRYACPLKVIEYMAAGLPALVTTGTEAADIVRRAGCGVAARYDVDAVAAAVIAMFSDTERYAELRHNGIEAARQLDWGTLLEREFDLITAAATKSSGEPATPSQETPG